MGCLQSKSRHGESKRYLKYSLKDTEGGDLSASPKGKFTDKFSLTSITKDGAEERKRSLKIEDFQFKNLRRTSACKAPGEVRGEQFMVDSCVECDLYVFDHCAAVTVDDCADCKMLIGPTESSVFVRDCAACRMVVACQQFRARDCHNCDVLILCRTRPIIESCPNIRIGCFDTSYLGLAQQMAAARLSFWHNHWSEVHNFTPAEGGWSYLPQDCSTQQLLGSFPTQATWAAAADSPRAAASCMVSAGHRPRPPAQPHYLWLLLPATQQAAASRLAAQAASDSSCTLLFTNQAWPLHCPSPCVMSCSSGGSVVGSCTGSAARRASGKAHGEAAQAPARQARRCPAGWKLFVPVHLGK